jgi:DNA ligase-1
MRPMKCESLMGREGKLHLDKITFPKLASPKFDGNRCYIEDGQAKSSTGKPIRNEYIREMLSDPALNGLDGELIVGSPTAKDVRRATTSGVSSYTGRPDFQFYVFDNFLLSHNFAMRTEMVNVLRRNEFVTPVPHELLFNLPDVEEYECKVLEQGYEGVILRCPNAPYKQGRSTLKENWALKLKRFVDAEATIIDTYERMHNDNEATKNEHGYTSRSSHGENKRPAGDLGGLTVRDLKTGVEFNVGTGFDAAERVALWDKRDNIVGKIITYKHFPIGAKDKPNLPSFVSFRDPEDM